MTRGRVAVAVAALLVAGWAVSRWAWPKPAGWDRAGEEDVRYL